MLLGFSSAFANSDDEVQNFVSSVQKSQYLQDATDFVEQILQFKNPKPISKKDILEPQKGVSSCGILDCSELKLQPKSSTDQNRYLIFISLSMPKESLKSLYLDSINHNATLVMRGLIDSSFKKTAEQLNALGIVVQVDPKLFKEYQVTKVPTVVLVTPSGQFNTLNGNVSFNYAKTKLLEAL